jgi:hypothetical protein
MEPDQLLKTFPNPFAHNFGVTTNPLVIGIAMKMESYCE